MTTQAGHVVAYTNVSQLIGFLCNLLGGVLQQAFLVFRVVIFLFELKGIGMFLLLSNDLNNLLFSLVIPPTDSCHPTAVKLGDDLCLCSLG